MSHFQRRLFSLILNMHPEAFRYEFGREMALDFEDALKSHGFLALFWDALLSLARQWFVCAFPETRTRGVIAQSSLLAGHYVMISQGGLTLFDLIRGSTLSVMFFSTVILAVYPLDVSAINLLLGHGRVPSQMEIPAPNASHEIVISDVTVIDVEHGTLQPHQTVFIHADQIDNIVPARAAKQSQGADEIDGRGEFLIPALWDMHTHIDHADRDFPMYIANGVLGIRNMGGPQDQVFQWKRDTDNGTVFGPRIFVSGPIVDGPHGPAPDSYAVRVANAEEARREVDTLKAKGADFVKVYDGLSRESYFAIADEAKKTNLPFAGHVPADITILEATNAGQRSIEHAIELRGGSTEEQYLIDLQRKQDFMAEAMRTQNFALIPEMIARNQNVMLDNFSQSRADSLYKTFVKNHTYLCPTLDVKQWLAFVDALAKQHDPRQRFVPNETLHWWQPEVNMLTKYRTPDYIAMRKREYAAIMQQIPRQQAAGVQLLAGTDLTVPFVYAGFSVHEEMQLFVKAGLTPLQALQTATIHPVEFFGLQSTMGSVTSGKLAELVLLDGNPLKNIRNTEKIAAVVTHGRLLRRADLDSLLNKASQSAQTAR